MQMQEIIAHVVSEPDYLKIGLTIATVVIAVISIAFTALTYRSVTAHNENTVRPILSMEQHADEGLYSISVLNAGFGPAIIKSVQYKYDGVFIGIKELLAKKISQNTINLMSIFENSSNTVAVLPQKSMLLIECKKSRMGDHRYETEIIKVRELFAETLIVVQYSGVYIRLELCEFKIHE